MQNRGTEHRPGPACAVALLLAVMTFLMPLLVYGGQGLAREPSKEPILPPSPTPAVPSSGIPSPPVSAAVGEADQSRLVKVLGADGKVTETNMAEYLWGVVAAEMPAAFQPDALRAQAVAARTYTVWKAMHNKAHPEANVCTDYTCCQAWISRDEALEKWAEQGAEYAEKLDRAVADTDGVVLYYDGQPVQAAFHSSSAGRTQDAVAVWGSTVPYLSSVATPEGEETPNYRTTVTMAVEAVRAALELLGCKLGDEPEEWFSNLSYGECGAVLSAQVGGVALRGNDLRTALGLRSPSFTAALGEDEFTFSVTGYGHGVGLSQYGANALAKEGKTWQEIVTWYYTGVELGDYDGPPTPKESASHSQSDGG